MDLSVVLPIYNEEDVIQATILEVNSFLKEKNFNFEIIVVDDGSTDDSFKNVKNLKIPNLVLLQNVKNLGKGKTIKKGMLAAQGELMLFMDADNSTSINNLPVFIQQIKENDTDIVIASRELPDSVINIHQPKFKENYGKLGNLLVRLLLLKEFKDTQCGFKLFKRHCLELFRKQRLAGWGFDFEILFLAKKYKYQVKELSVIWTDNPKSEVKFIDYFKTLAELFLVKYNNLTRKYDN
ncbi:glycosyltransferase [Patescibacteria group bacterium]|nr:glycosyltransferase [Patescibacteria group bacterium]